MHPTNPTDLDHRPPVASDNEPKGSEPAVPTVQPREAPPEGGFCSLGDIATAAVRDLNKPLEGKGSNRDHVQVFANAGVAVVAAAAHGVWDHPALAKGRNAKT